MATITLAGDTDYSELTVANGDTIDCAGFILTLDEQPTETGIQVTTPGTAGTVVFSGGWVIPTWDFFAGTTTLIATLPANSVIGNVTGGTSGGASRGIGTNLGEISGDVTAGSGPGVNINRYLIRGRCVCVSGGNPNAVVTNDGTILGDCEGGSASRARSVGVNNGIILGKVIGGTFDTLSSGVHVNSGICIGGIEDNTSAGVGTYYGQTTVINGPLSLTTIPDNIKTIYSLGTLSASATIAADANVIELSKGKGLTGIR